MGNEAGKFGIGTNITREDLSVILYRVISSYGISSKPSQEEFDDDDEISDYAKDAIYRLKEMKILHGVGDNNFAPKAHVTRAMAAKAVFAMIKAVEI